MQAIVEFTSFLKFCIFLVQYVHGLQYNLIPSAAFCHQIHAALSLLLSLATGRST